MNKYFKRGNQYVCKKPDGKALLINTTKPNTHYDGDGFVFMERGQFNEGPIWQETTEKDWEKVRNEYVERMKSY